MLLGLLQGCDSQSFLATSFLSTQDTSEQASIACFDVFLQKSRSGLIRKIVFTTGQSRGIIQSWQGFPCINDVKTRSVLL